MGFHLDIKKAFAVGVLVASSCSGHLPAPRAPDAPSVVTPPEPGPGPLPPEGPASQTGFATYYARRFAGRRTANGDRYDPSLLTAAHRTLPFGTMVEVRRGDRRVVVRINDRGPYGDADRVIDLSRRAAEELGIVQEGKAPVELRPIAQP